MNTSLEALRLRAEADVAARFDPNKPQTRRPSWAPPLVLAGELLDLCIKLSLLKPEDKPIARLWGQFADPKKLGRTLRETNRDTAHAMAGVACRGFNLCAGPERGNSLTILFRALRYGDGTWQTGPRWREPDRDPHYKVHHAQRDVDGLRQTVESYAGLPEWKNPFEDFTKALENAEHKLAEVKADSEKQHQAAMERLTMRRRATELAAARVAELAGDYDVQTQFAGSLSGQCRECFRTLTDPRSLEIGIGPDCLETTLVISPQGRLVRMIDAINNGQLAAADGKLRWVAAA